MKSIPSVFASCDWGSSRFRLRLVRSDSLQVLGEKETDMGVKQTHDNWVQSGRPDRARFFHDYLCGQLSDIPAEDGRERIPAVVSGMASSSIGMQELDYQRLPLNVLGDNLLSHALFSDEDVPVILVSGVRSESNIMRGEETQAIGLAAALDIQNPGVLLLPGTHSKHLEFDKGAYLDFRTFMTGELFAVLCSHSLLRESVRECPLDGHEAAFRDGVSRGGTGQLSGELFSIRARDILGQSNPEDNFHYLSGLLLGHELACLAELKTPVYLAAPPRLITPYRIALELLLPRGRVHCLEADVLDKALLKAHRAVLASRLG